MITSLEYLMKSYIAIFLLLISTSFLVKAEQTCHLREDLLGAYYQLTNSKTHRNEQEYSITDKAVHLSSLWRTNQKVLSINGEQSTTWYRLNNGLVQKTTHFDHFKRSIEYQAKPMSEEYWQQIRQLIPNSKKHTLTLVNTTADECYQQEQYQWHSDDSNLSGKLLWNKNLNLMTELTITQGDKKSHWQLQKIERNQDVINQFFAQRANYQSTDFADIGDNESDPFLIKMINLGFIDHSASGIYNANGESMAIQHNH